MNLWAGFCCWSRACWAAGGLDRWGRGRANGGGWRWRCVRFRHHRLRYDAGHVLSGNELALLVGMPRLSALGLGLAARGLDRARRCGKGVREGRLQGVLRVLVETRFEGSNLRQQFILAGLRCQEGRLNGGLCCQQRTNKRLHPWRGGCPFFWRQVYWRHLVHSSSMP